MAPSRTIVIAGGGIGGLTAALALAARGFRTTVLEQAPALETAGAGIQLSPNATRILTALGLADRIRRDAVIPQSVDIRAAQGQPIARIPLGDYAAAHYGAPYWSLHRADLQAALAEAVHANPDITLKLGTRVEDFVVHPHGMTIACRRGAMPADETGLGLIAADGVWSALRQRLGHSQTPEFRQRVAWRALVPAERVAPDMRTPNVRLWLGRDAHLVHYPVSAGRLINIVAIVQDQWRETGWLASGERDALLARYPRRAWCEPVRELLAEPERWSKWALYDLAPLHRAGRGPITLIGDAAHPTLPFLAQGAALAIEDAAVLAQCLARTPDDIAAAMRAYERSRRARTRAVQQAARRNSRIYHLAGAEALMRNLGMKLLGGPRLLRHYDWLYGWTPEPR